VVKNEDTDDTHLPGLLQLGGPLLLQDGLDGTDEFRPDILRQHRRG